MSNTYLYGLFAEKIASEYMLKEGFKLLFNRYKTPYGELDLVMNKSDLITFIEVKARKKLHKNYLEETITTTQQRRNYNAAEFFLSENQQYHSFLCRFDLVIIQGNKIFNHIVGIYT
jgi:putative endonuclease